MRSLQLLLVFGAALFLSSCGDGGGSSSGAKDRPPVPSAASAFAKAEYRSRNHTKTVRLMTASEIEYSEGRDNCVGSYAKEGNKIRAVIDMLGTKRSLYFVEVETGILQAEADGDLYYREAVLAKVLERERREAAKVKAALSSGQKEITLEIGGGATMDFVLVPAGSFEMGEKGETYHVTLTKAFYMGKYEVTQRQYQAVIGNNPSQFKGDNNPVEQVSWNDAVAFCEKLNAGIPSGAKMALPTEAQWEYACRAGTKTEYYSGDDEEGLKSIAWYNGNSDKKTHPVGEKKPNAFGLYDMSGNVCEWCQDWYGHYPQIAVTDPSGLEKGSYRVIRGGRWDCNPQYCRSAYRTLDDPSSTDFNFGFRVVMSIP